MTTADVCMVLVHWFINKLWEYDKIFKAKWDFYGFDELFIYFFKSSLENINEKRYNQHKYDSIEKQSHGLSGDRLWYGKEKKKKNFQGHQPHNKDETHPGAVVLG